MCTESFVKKELSMLAIGCYFGNLFKKNCRLLLASSRPRLDKLTVVVVLPASGVIIGPVV